MKPRPRTSEGGGGGGGERGLSEEIPFRQENMRLKGRKEAAVGVRGVGGGDDLRCSAGTHRNCQKRPARVALVLNADFLSQK